MPSLIELLPLSHSHLKMNISSPIRVLSNEFQRTSFSGSGSTSVATSTGTSNQRRKSVDELSNLCWYSFSSRQLTSKKSISRQAAFRFDTPRSAYCFHCLRQALAVYSRISVPNETAKAASAEENFEGRNVSKCSAWSRTYVVISYGDEYQPG